MSVQWTGVIADVIAVVAMVIGIYWPRHRRKGLVVAFLAVNTGVLAVSMIMAASTIGAGVGLGLFGVLSIIRLRSDEITQHEIAYYFAALVLALVGGLPAEHGPLTFGPLALIHGTLYVADHPRLFARHRNQLVRLDRAVADEDELRAVLGALVGGRVTEIGTGSGGAAVTVAGSAPVGSYHRTGVQRFAPISLAVKWRTTRSTSTRRTCTATAVRRRAGGAGPMTESPDAESEQSFVAATFDSVAAGAEITITDADGGEVAAFTAAKDIASAVYSSAEIEDGATYPVSADGKKLTTATAGEALEGMGMPGGSGQGN